MILIYKYIPPFDKALSQSNIKVNFNSNMYSNYRFEDEYTTAEEYAAYLEETLRTPQTPN